MWDLRRRVRIEGVGFRVENKTGIGDRASAVIGHYFRYVVVGHYFRYVVVRYLSYATRRIRTVLHRSVTYVTYGHGIQRKVTETNRQATCTARPNLAAVVSMPASSTLCSFS